MFKPSDGEENNYEKLDSPTDANRGNQTSEPTEQGAKPTHSPLFSRGVPPLFTFQIVTTAYDRVNGEQLHIMAQHVPTKRRNRIRESKNLGNGDKVGLQETLTIAFRVLRAGTQRTNSH